jgi:hypothetical protein
VDISDGIGLVTVIIEMVYLLGDEVLDSLSELFLVAIGPKIEDVRSRVVGFLEDGEGFHLVEVLVEDVLHAFIKESVVRCYELSNRETI